MYTSISMQFSLGVVCQLLVYVG